MTANVILHIGINETGAPAIQHWFAGNQAALLAQGVLYPACGRQGDSHDLLGNVVTPRPAAAAPGGQEVSVGRLLSLRDALREEITASGAGQVVISSDALAWLADLNPVQDLFRKMPVKVVIYLRRHDHWWEDVYRESISARAGQDAPESGALHEPGFLPFMRARRAEAPEYGEFAVLVDRWAAAFGRENTLLLPVEEPLRPDLLVSDFIRVTGLNVDVSSLAHAPQSPPRRLSRLQLQMLDAFSHVRTTPELRRRLLDHARQASGPDAAQSTLLPPKRRLELIRKNAESYEQIAREYLGREDGNLFIEALPTQRDDWEPPPELSTIDFVEAAIRAVTESRATRPPGLLARLLKAD